jgi:Tol biopolymer transport system component
MSHHSLSARCRCARISHRDPTIATRGSIVLTRGLFALVTLMTLLAAHSTNALAASHEGIDETFPASVTPTGEFAEEITDQPPSISADGRYVTFTSHATNLGEHGPTGVNEAYVKDLYTGEVKLVSRAGLDGEPANDPEEAGGVENAMISGNGRYVVFTSTATNLVSGLPSPEPGEHPRHLYRRDLQTGETVLVDRVTGADGTILNSEGNPKAEGISENGRYILFKDETEDLEDPAGKHEQGLKTVYVRDVQAGTTTAVSRASGVAGELANASSGDGSISPNGRYVAFKSAATNLVEGMGSNAVSQVYVRDLQTNTTTLISKTAPTAGAPNGEPGNQSSENPILVGESGCAVAYESTATNLYLYEGSPLAGPQIYLADDCISPATTTLLSRANGEDGAPANTGGETPEILGASADGQDILFSATLNAAGTGPETLQHLYIRDLQTGQTTPIDRASGAEGEIANSRLEGDGGAISANGCRVAFASKAENLTEQPLPVSAENEIYIRQLASCHEEPSITPQSVTFADQSLDTLSGPQQITLTAGSETLAVHNLQLAGPGASDFLVTSDECSKETLEPGQTCTFLVRFVPGATGPLSASLAIHTEPALGLEPINLKGEGIEAAAGVQDATDQTGPAGSTGPAGPQGINGQTGADGKTGPSGKTGPRGPVGRDAKVRCVLVEHGRKVSCSVTFQGHRARRDTHALLIKNGHTYAQGPLADLDPSRAIQRGVYTLRTVVAGYALAVQTQLR